MASLRDVILQTGEHLEHIAGENLLFLTVGEVGRPVDITLGIVELVSGLRFDDREQ